MYWLPRSVGRSKEGKFKHAGIFLHDPVIVEGIILIPTLNHSYTTAYAEAVSAFGRMIEVRVARNTQHLPIFVRMLDKVGEKNASCFDSTFFAIFA